MSLRSQACNLSSVLENESAGNAINNSNNERHPICITSEGLNCISYVAITGLAKCR